MDAEPPRAEKVIAAAAKLITPKTAYPWYFLPMGTLRLDDSDSCIEAGDMYYTPLLHEIGPALRIADWVFVVERKTALCKQMMKITEPEDEWDCAAFHGTAHYTFNRFKGTATNLQKVVLEFALPFCRLLRPDVMPATPPKNVLMCPYDYTRFCGEVEKARAAGFRIKVPPGLDKANPE